MDIALAPPVRREVSPDTEWTDLLAGVHTVVHLAAAAHQRAEVHERSRDYAALRRINALGTECLARAAARAGVKRFIFMSTLGVCGDETFGAPFTEDSAPAPHSLYARSKLEAEHLLAAVTRETALPVIVLRPTLAYGPENGGNFLRLLRAVDRGLPLPFASIHNRRSLTYVGNLVSAIKALLLAPPLHGVFVVCDSEAVSTADIVRGLATAMERPARLFPAPSAVLRVAARTLGKDTLMRRLVGSLEADCGKLARIIGWRPPIPVYRGLFETGAWYRLQNRARASG
jgi:nucleoside-diphosphate-sugar epimerase